jgi:hypothetical protein
MIPLAVVVRHELDHRSSKCRSPSGIIRSSHSSLIVELAKEGVEACAADLAYCTLFSLASLVTPRHFHRRWVKLSVEAHAVGIDADSQVQAAFSQSEVSRSHFFRRAKNRAPEQKGP